MINPINPIFENALRHAKIIPSVEDPMTVYLEIGIYRYIYCDDVYMGYYIP